MRTIIIITCAMCLVNSSQAQIIRFHQDPGTAETWYRCVESDIGYCVDSLRIDTIYTENIRTRDLKMVVQRYPFARYEFYADSGLFRRIDIQQKEEMADYSIEDIEVGEVVTVVHSLPIDIPNGAYHEFFPNGNIRIKGTLDGYNPDGTLKKTGEWTEWDEHGKVIRRETYP